ncbi:agmatinase [Natrarchaeobius halalkaliphilus]|uniref:Agmatinase n=1 Tax=Natrarchaeobius halalkaliphilus TaxID=1679091 RepID=A0A3N6LP24_9EURY|nr:arginase family protein [Natrarchaeobius halalkaliphilus]RQG87987.1 agmatinase [Natrarchaeobius halalkaliphilus]
MDHSRDIDPERLERYRSLATEEHLDGRPETEQAYIEASIDRDDDGPAPGYDPVWYYHSTNGMFRAPHNRDLSTVDLACVGVPMDIGTPNERTGSRLGPRELRRWSQNHGPANPETGVNPFERCSVSDWGDVRFTDDPYDLSANVEELYERYVEFDDADVTPLTVGGEHTITYPILRALGRDEPLGLIHLDAHPDTRAGEYHGAGVTDANLVTNAVTEGVIDPERTIQIGVRGRVLLSNDFSHETGMRVVEATEFQDAGPQAIAEEARRVVGDGPCYVTVDTDVFDCGVMPGTTLPEPFGLTGREVRDFLRGIRGTNIVGADLVELSPPYDDTGKSGCLAAGIAFELLSLVAEARDEFSDDTGRTTWNTP